MKDDVAQLGADKEGFDPNFEQACKKTRSKAGVRICALTSAKTRKRAIFSDTGRQKFKIIKNNKFERKTDKAMRCVFLDRDGTLNIDKGYSNKIEDLEIIGNPIHELYYLKRLGFYIIVVSNQAGAKLGYYTEKDIEIFNQEIQKKLFWLIDDFFVCTHTPDENCNCRKPKTGLIEKALQKYEISLENSFVIGDKAADIEMGEKVGAKTILVLTGHGKKEVTKAKPDFVAENITQALRMIRKKTENEIFPVCVSLKNSKKLLGVIDTKEKYFWVKFQMEPEIYKKIIEKTMIFEKNEAKSFGEDINNYPVPKIVENIPVDFILGTAQFVKD
jgi:D-glycero-D-manno-heptose 1,7-bisphosphate phosphatase